MYVKFDQSAGLLKVSMKVKPDVVFFGESVPEAKKIRSSVH